MEPYQQKVINEKNELDSKIRALIDFFGTDTYADLSFDDQDRLSRQEKCMIEYSNVLAERIEAFMK